MHVKVKLFATLKDYAPVQGSSGTPFDMEVADNATLGDIVTLLKLPLEEVKIPFVNGIVKSLDWRLSKGDEIGIFRRLEEDEMTDIIIDTWLYGILAKYGGDENQRIFANVQVPLEESSTITDLLDTLKMPTEERGITFINGDLSAMVGLQPDLSHVLKDKDRVAFFHLNAMWPFQYRLGIQMANEMTDAMITSKDMGIHHTYK